jgi:deoxyribodipyrimidine photo-lyase
MKRAVVWFRRDYRLSDNTALHEALQKCEEVYPVFIFDDKILNAGDIGGRCVAYVLQALESLQKNLEHVDSHLIICHGEPIEEMTKLIKDLKADALFFNVDYENYARQRDEKMVKRCNELQVKTFPCDDNMIHAPDEVLKDDGTPYLVFTPYSKKWRNIKKKEVLSRPKKVHSPEKVKSLKLPSLKDLGFALDINLPEVGEKAAHECLKKFLEDGALHYKSQRDLPYVNGTSRLSPFLRHGLIESRTVFHEIEKLKDKNPKAKVELDTFTGELIWRDFYKMILWYYPHAEKQSFKKDYADLKWDNNEKHFKAWCEGKTGIPIVDAAMRQLNETGWMHNRLRMITASFLTKDLLVDWKWGEQYFMKQLFDGDISANNGGWQWSASTGTDAQPYFRIFNPTSQQNKFDPEFKFIKKYIPEYGTDGYPKPIVDHAVQRERTLKLYKSARSS